MRWPTINQFAIGAGESGLAYLAWCRGEHDEYQRRLENAGESAYADMLRSSVTFIAGDPAQALRILPAAGRSDADRDDGGQPHRAARAALARHWRPGSGRGRVRALDGMVAITGERDLWTTRQHCSTWLATRCVNSAMSRCGARCSPTCRPSPCSVRSPCSSGFGATNPDYLCGRLALSLGLPLDEAEQHFRTGLEWASRPDVRFVVDEGRCHQGLAEVAERRGDIEAARTHLDAAGALFAQHGGARCTSTRCWRRRSIGGVGGDCISTATAA